MSKKTFSASLTLFLSSFFLMSALNAMSPQITEEHDPETNGLRLFVRGKITVPPKDKTSQPLFLTFRTCALEDFQKADGSWGFVSELRADPIQMEHFIGGPRDPAITLEKGYKGIWRKRLIEREKGCYTPATLFTLFTQDPNTSEPPKGIGYFALGRNTPTQLIFFAGLFPEFQGKGIITIVVKYVLNELLPAFRTHSLTSAKSREEHQEMLITMAANNPLAPQIVGSSVPKFSEKHGIPITHKTEEKERKDTGGAPVKRIEHQFTVNLTALYAARETTAASAAPSGAAARDALTADPKQ